jgi:23S rRNA pseudouridine1911/1915/1917 synthase
MSILKKIQIIHETKDFIAVNKPAHLLVHPVSGFSKDNEKTLTNFILSKYPEVKNVGDRPDIRPGIVHRLDRNTSGILIIAHNQIFFDYFKNLLKQREIKKTYLALVWGKVIEKGLITSSIGLKPDTTRWSTRGKNLKMVKEAVTEYEPINIYHKKDDDEFFTLLKLTPRTGRTHQLRVHTASIHHSIVGDNMYGKKDDPFNLDRQFLHALSIEFNNKKGERIKLEAPLPQDLNKVLGILDIYTEK